MRTIRIFFTKMGVAAYISHLDLQRVMARALRRSGLPVWYSQGFNPHIYMSFVLPLPLMQESETEAVDFKMESDEVDFSAFLPALRAALPKGIEATSIAIPVHKAQSVAKAEYHISYNLHTPSDVAKAVDKYNQCEVVMVLRKTKRSEAEVNLKDVLPKLNLLPDNALGFAAVLPAGSELNYNPNLLTGFLEAEAGLPASGARIVRKNILLQNDAIFC